MELTAYDPSLPQRRFPCGAIIIAEHVDDRGVKYRVRVSNRGRDWWLTASLHGFRCSNTLHTCMPEKAHRWINAVRGGYVKIVAAPKVDGTRSA